MSVRQSLLAVLAQGPCYGYQLRTELERRGGRAINVGQIYNTLERLERDALVAKGDVDAQGHVYYAATDAGRRAATAWLVQPLPRAAAARDELVAKLSLAATLPGVDAEGAARAERDAASVRLASLRAAPPADEPANIAQAIAHDALLAQAEAELAWLDRVLERLASHAPEERERAISEARPKRGRPARAA